MKMMKKISTLFAAAVISVVSTAAMSENYHVVVHKYGYYPDISWVQPGDTITFVNRMGRTARIWADGSPITSYIGNNSTRTVTLNSVPDQFDAPYFYAGYDRYDRQYSNAQPSQLIIGYPTNGF